ncbi:ankyrin repeat-containing domain protein [Lactarius hatsudake]|nr:ankyrin repeat-containing domain protein [Lactarius hatsudake]
MLATNPDTASGGTGTSGTGGTPASGSGGTSTGGSGSTTHWTKSKQTKISRKDGNRRGIWDSLLTVQVVKSVSVSLRRAGGVAELLVKYGACVNVQGDSALLRIFNFPDDAQAGAVRFLLEHGTWVNTAHKDLWTPMHMAAETGLPEIAQPRCWSSTGWTPIFGTITACPIAPSASQVLNSADVNAQDTDGMTPLHCASQHGQPEIAQLLLDHGENAHVEDVQSQNPLHEVSRRHGFSNSPAEYTRRAGLLIDAYRPRPCASCLDGVTAGVAGNGLRVLHAGLAPWRGSSGGLAKRQRRGLARLEV